MDSELVYSYLTAEPQIEATLRRRFVNIISPASVQLNGANGSLYKSGCYNAPGRHKS